MKALTQANENFGNKVQVYWEICWWYWQDAVRIFLWLVCFSRGWKGLILFCILIAQASCINGIPVGLLHWHDLLFLGFFYIILPESLTHAESKVLENPTYQNKHLLVKSSWNWMSMMQQKKQKRFKAAFFGGGDHSTRHNGGLLWLSCHVQRLMSCSQRAKVNEWDRCVLICCSVSGRCALSMGCSLSNHILTRQLLWKKEWWRMWDWNCIGLTSLASLL